MRLLKKITLAFMLLTMLSQTFSSLVVIGHYEMNRRYYAEVLCQNKNRPELACEGKCALMLKINNYAAQKQENNNQSLQNFINQDLNWVFYEIASIGFNPSLGGEVAEHISNFFHKTYFPQHGVGGLLRPPIV
jgi:hypothetical protein